MTKRTFDLLKKNPVILFLFLGSFALTVLFKKVSFNRLMLAPPPEFRRPTGPVAGHPFMYFFLILIMFLYFIGTFGIIAEMISTNKANIMHLFYCFKKYFIRALLLVLLFLILGVGVMIVLFLATFMVLGILLLIVRIRIDPMSIFHIVSYGFILLVPFIILCIPSIFLEDVEVMDGFSRGLKLGARYYFYILPMIIIQYLPIAVSDFFFKSRINLGVPFDTKYIVSTLIFSLISAFTSVYFFVLYDEKKKDLY